MTVRRCFTFLLVVLGDRVHGLRFPALRAAYVRSSSSLASSSTATSLQENHVLVAPSGTLKIFRVDDGSNEHAGKPKLLFLPGLDGVGSYSGGEVRKLRAAYDVWQLEASPTDRSTFMDVAAFVNRSLGLVAGDANGPVVLIGESFGGLLASHVALRAGPSKVSQLVLVNPATSFGRTSWETTAPLLASVPAPAFPLVALATLMGTAVDANQFQRIGRRIVASINSTESAVRLLNGMLDSAKNLTTLLSPETLTWRVSRWLGEGSFVLEDQYSNIKVPTLILTGKNDRLLPSREEGRRLKRLIGGGGVKVELKEFDNGHALLEEGFLDLANVITRSPVFAPPDRDVYDCPMPTAEDLADLEKQFGGVVKAMSPIFLSRDATTGRLTKGIKAVPLGLQSGRPVLLVGNHQLFGGDLMPIVREFLQERNTLIRGMAHPTLFRGAFPGQQQMQQTDGGIYSKFGALEVSPFSFYEMLKRNETVLLFPGGAREALHGRGENNKLFWPEKVDFVRMAGIFNAIIVPFAAVGVADSVNFVGPDREDLKRAPAWLRGGESAGSRPAMAQARAGVVEDITPSFFLPKPQGPERMYIMFQQPIDTAGVDIYNKKQSRELYDKVRGSVEDGIETLKTFREADPYRSFVARAVYETNSGGQPAPTAPLISVK